VQLISKDIRALLCLQTPYAATSIEKEKKERRNKHISITNYAFS
jgi:hypothetical protein